MNILITGLGALGTVFATLLKKSGNTVFALAKEKYLPLLAEKKVRVTGIWGTHEAVLDGVISDIALLRSTRIDLIVLTVKAYDTAEAIRQLKPVVRTETLVLTAQNGYGNYETVSAEIGREHTLLSRVIFGSKLISTGQAEVTVIADDVRVGQPDRAVQTERIREIVSAINSAGIPTSYADDVYPILWDKIIYNCALNPLGAVLECTYGDLAAHDGSRQIMNAIIREIFLATKAHNISLRWKNPDEYASHFYKNLVPPTAKHFPSMFYDLKAGKRPEIDALNGAVVRLARDKGLAAPVNETIIDLIKTKESLRSVAIQRLHVL